jgi:hypothetical protein
LKIGGFDNKSKLGNFIKKEMAFKTSNRKRKNNKKIEIKVLGRKEIISLFNKIRLFWQLLIKHLVIN